MGTKLRAAALAALLIVALTPIAAGATFPGDNGRIIVDRDFPVSPFLVSMEPDGSDVTRMPEGSNASAFGASWSPDGSRFIYSRVINGRVDLFLRDADGSNLTRVTDNNSNRESRVEFFPAFGPDGNQAVYQRCGSRCGLFHVNLTTLTETRLTGTRIEIIEPDWSVDDVIVFERTTRDGDSEVFTMDPDGTNVVRLTDNERRHDVSPSWSPDGDKIVYSRCGGVKFNCDLFTMNADGSGKDRVTDTNALELGAKFSPDGLFFVTTRKRRETRFETYGDLWRMSTDGTGLLRLTDTPSKSELHPDWQPIVE